LGSPKAIALQQAAVLVDPKNYMAANELGVLLARYGAWEDARLLFQHSLAISPRPETWRNLATACEKLGAKQEADRAHRQHERLARAAREDAPGAPTAGPGGAVSMVYWVDPVAFAGGSPGTQLSEVEPKSSSLAHKPQAIPADKTPEKSILPEFISGPLDEIKSFLSPGPPNQNANNVSRGKSKPDQRTGVSRNANKEHVWR
jgi:tetratricopeptide (TPR) repeat protein